MPKPKLGTKTVLIIDDDEELRKLLKTLLESEGYAVSTAAAGMEGVLKTIRNLPNLIICDINMAGMDGFETCRQIQRRLSSDQSALVPIIMLTGNNTQRDVLEALDAGAIDFLIKPFDPAKLLDKVKTYVQPMKAAVRSIAVKDFKDKTKAPPRR